MPCISCNSKDCAYNKEGGCVLNGIDVGGSFADSTSETICESFTEQNMQNSTENEIKHACDNQNIDCSATECEYNNNRECTADSILIEKDGNCKTFRI